MLGKWVGAIGWVGYEGRGVDAAFPSWRTLPSQALRRCLAGLLGVEPPACRAPLTFHLCPFSSFLAGRAHHHGADDGRELWEPGGGR